MDFLLGVPAKLKTLTDRLTATRAGYLDNLDAPISTVDTNVDTLVSRLTAARAGYLDNIATSMGIKSVQRGYTSVNTAPAARTVTITAVNTSKAFVITNNIWSYQDANGYARLTSSTTLEIQSYYYVDPSYYGQYVAWEVVEFY